MGIPRASVSGLHSTPIAWNIYKKKNERDKETIRKSLLLQKSSVKGLKDVLKGNVKLYNAKYIGVCNHYIFGRTNT